MEDKAAFKNQAMISYVVKKLQERNEEKQVGKTIVQKFFYLLTREGVSNYRYSLYHYGPYSSEVSNDLDYANNLALVTIVWEDDKGYFIKATDKEREYEGLLQEEEKAKIDQLVEQFADFKAIDLSILATGLFLGDNYKISDEGIPKAVHEVKPNFSRQYIEDIWKKGATIHSRPCRGHLTLGQVN